jgi:hypothetical protein
MITINIAYHEIFIDFTIPVNFEYREKNFNVIHFREGNDAIVLLLSFDKQTYQERFVLNTSLSEWVTFVNKLLDDVNFSKQLKVN